MNYDALIQQYRVLINGLSSAIGIINDGNEQLKKIPLELEKGLLVNDKILDEQVFTNSLNTNNQSKDNLRTAIGSCNSSIARLQELKRQEEERRRAEAAAKNKE